MQYDLDAKEREIANTILDYAPLNGSPAHQPTLFWATKLAAMVDPNDSRAEHLYKFLGHCIFCETRGKELYRMYCARKNSGVSGPDDVRALDELQTAFRRYALDAKSSASQTVETVAKVVASKCTNIRVNALVSQADLYALATEDLLKTAYTTACAVMTMEPKAPGL